MIKKFLKDNSLFNKKYSSLNLPKNVSLPINIFSLIFLTIVIVPIFLILSTSFKVYNVFRINFIIILFIGVIIFLLFYSYNEIIAIKYFRFLYHEDQKKFISALEVINTDVDVQKIVEEIDNYKLIKYWLYLFIKSVFICSICLIVFYIILRKIFR